MVLKILIQPCTQRGQFRSSNIYSRLKTIKDCISHETAGYIMKFMLSTVKDFKKKLSQLELHYVPNTHPEYSRDSPHIRNNSKGNRNKGIVSSERMPPSLSNNKYFQESVKSSSDSPLVNKPFTDVVVHQRNVSRKSSSE